MYYQLKAIRKNTKPPIWRRISVPSDITFAQLAVILESILEFPYSDSYEFEFYTRKVRLSEFAEKKEKPSDFYYSYLHSPDTYINGWMESEKAFSFGMNGGDDSLPKYRIEIEKLLENVEVKDGDTYRKTNFPVIMKQASAPVDPILDGPPCGKYSD